ncbi:hypothetical protein [Mycolicibacterium mucogenicum]|uniref:Uncharacterized protein n=1 Tax=Mycolicibacterium mucogenicum TaxID=56689 RepID=A0A4R5WP32_MYCMU|nr:hypothetical protein [Mycolicibacterium mucogenicum]TDK93199.1 hypothetical protein EUA03_03855 [Mycolicibacterium mucogenicum]
MTYLRCDMSSALGATYQWDMNVCRTWYFVKGDVPYQDHLRNGVWDSDNPPNVREDWCDFCW